MTGIPAILGFVALLSLMGWMAIRFAKKFVG